MSAYDLSNSYAALPDAFVEESRKTLRASMSRIEHVLNQLNNADVWWRPHDSMNAAGNILLHLAGNLGQWIVAMVPNVPAERDRPAEFAQREPIPKAVLLRRLRETVEACDRAIGSLKDESDLVARRVVQGYDTCVAAAILHAVSHFEGHTQELIYIARLRIGDGYRFQWVPGTPAQVSGRA